MSHHGLSSHGDRIPLPELAACYGADLFMEDEDFTPQEKLAIAVLHLVVQDFDAPVRKSFHSVERGPDGKRSIEVGDQAGEAQLEAILFCFSDDAEW